MRRLFCVILALAICLSFTACGSSPAKKGTLKSNSKTVDEVLAEGASGAGTVKSAQTVDSVQKKSADNGKYDVDLTVMNSTMVYAEVNNMVSTPDDYIGKTVKMSGNFAVSETEERNYYACLIADATACCSQGIEFELANAGKYPDDYPEIGSLITVTGIFDIYYEGEQMYCQLIDAKLI